MEEIWKPIKDNENYTISNYGKVKNKKGKLCNIINNYVSLNKRKHNLNTLMVNTFGHIILLDDEEVFKDVIGYEGLYKISNRKRIIDSKTGKILKQSQPNPTIFVALRKDGIVRRISVNKLYGQVFYEKIIDDLEGEVWKNLGDIEEFKEYEYYYQISNMGRIKTFKDGIEKLLTDNIFAPLQKDRVCNNIGVIHKDKNDVDIDTIVAEVGKPLNISEGWGGKCTLIAVSGMSFPTDHVQRLGKLAIDGQKERQRNIEMAKEQNLPELDFGNIEKPKTNTASKTKLSGRDALLAMRKKTRT